MEWIWAAPCSNGLDSCGAPTELFGAHDPSQAEWALWSDLAELIIAFTGKRGSPWLPPFHNHCDQADLVDGHIWHAFANDLCDPLYVNGCEEGSTEIFFVRDHIGAVADPHALVLSLAGIAMIGWARFLLAVVMVGSVSPKPCDAGNLGLFEMGVGLVCDPWADQGRAAEKIQAKSARSVGPPVSLDTSVVACASPTNAALPPT